jgi:hypothetical protein
MLIKENSIVQNRYVVEREWSIPELLESFDPLYGEPLAERNAAIRQLLPKAMESYDDLSDLARLRLDFWRHFAPQQVDEQWVKYTTTVTNTYNWELTVNADGLFFNDLSGEYSSHPGRVYEQMHCDFWFFGPLMPMPDLEVRKKVLSVLRNALTDLDSPVAKAHFELFEYPSLENAPMWEEGDNYRKDYVILRKHGIEHGATTWRDGLLYSAFIAYERFLAQPAATLYGTMLTPTIRERIEQHISRRFKVQPQLDGLSPTPNAKSKQLFMEAKGKPKPSQQGYDASPKEEAVWHLELKDRLAQQLRESDKEEVLRQLAESLHENGAPVVDLLYEVAQAALPKAKMALSKLLMEKYDPERGVEIHMTLLEYEAQDSYWRDYVFSAFNRQRHNPAVQRWLVKCLRGDNEQYFKKAVDVLVGWGLMFGHAEFADRDMLRALNWQDACAADPDFKKAIEKVVKLIGDS